MAVGLVEHRDFSVHTEDVTLDLAGRGGSATTRESGTASTGLFEYSAIKAVTRIEVFRTHRQTVQYIFPHQTDALKQAELLVVDEAASIPLPTVRALLGMRRPSRSLWCIRRHLDFGPLSVYSQGVSEVRIRLWLQAHTWLCFLLL